MPRKTAIIIGAGPAGLTAAYELLTRTDIRPVVYEATGDIGGISKTVNYKGNRIDIGGHRFFSKSDVVMEWWQNILPVQGRPARDDIIPNRAPSLSPGIEAPDPEKTDKVMLIRGRVSRIFFLRSFFDYPLSLKYSTFRNLGLKRTLRTGFSYMRSAMFPIRREASLEDFFINRFGRELYLTFFKDYTEKIWGMPCSQIQPDWGSQRFKRLSVTRSVARSLKTARSKDTSPGRKDTETSLVEQFMYPKLGPGQLWEEVSRQVIAMGGTVHLKHQAIGLDTLRKSIQAARVLDREANEVRIVQGDYFFSTMPVQDLITGMSPAAPQEVRKIAEGLVYRDFITVGLLLKRLKIRDSSSRAQPGRIPDNWIYIQERDVKLGRLQIFNNWSPYLVKDPDTVWLGLEYFCTVGDELWSKPDDQFAAFAAGELALIGMIDPDDVLDQVVIRMPRTYPAYSGTYAQLNVIRDYVDRFENLFLVGRNGMHKYNNADHSMLTAMTAVSNIIGRNPSKENLWLINTEEDYHETREG